MIDKKAKKILYNTYWTSKGWRDNYAVSNEDFDYAKSKGLMFDKVNKTHDEIIKSAINVRAKVNLSRLIQGFLSSLSNRDLRFRSAIQSYYHLSDLSNHDFEEGNFDLKYLCKICETNKEDKGIDLSVLNFERLKWGGVRKADILYNLFDLELFNKIKIPEPQKEDIQIFEKILDCIETSNDHDNYKILEKRLSNCIQSNSNEREQLVEILGSMEILEPKQYDKNNRHSEDWIVLSEWRGKDKYNIKVTKRLFKKWMN